MRKSLPLVLAVTLAIPLAAHADVFDIHVGGICSTDFGSTLGGDGWLAPFVQSAILPGHDDGAVSEASAGGYTTTDGRSSICEAAPNYANHQAWFSCEYGSLNHLDMKLKMICDDGGLTTGCP